jgi:hypothetical protein
MEIRARTMADSVQDRKTQWSPDVGRLGKLIEAATGYSPLTHLADAEAPYDDSDGYDHNSECDP